ncbi:sulfatase-like hydrolase/transferase, partial [Escherichia coli]|nr:sulfatase-like hydrolase/transferase [Escherichia coli]
MIFGGLVSDIIKEYKSLQVDNLPASSWLIKNKITPKYNTYVVVIGESMRKDFMSLYGFSLDTTPFIDSIPKRYISNYITTAINTTLAVPRILSKTSDNGSVYEQDNIVELANMAGLNTFWISSQGYSGQYNIASSRISNYAKFKYF